MVNINVKPSQAIIGLSNETYLCQKVGMILYLGFSKICKIVPPVICLFKNTTLSFINNEQILMRESPSKNNTQE